MAAPAGDSNPLKDLAFFVGVIFLIMMVWYFMGGRKSPYATSGPTLNVDQSGNISAGKEGAKSGFTNKISLDLTYNGESEFAAKEYVVIEASSANSEKINITGWRLENKDGQSGYIGQGAQLPKPDQQNELGKIYLAPGEKAYIVTGTSPLGLNFKINKCSGYFVQNVPFYPAITKECPNPADAESYPSYVDNECIDYMKSSIEKCKSYFSLPSNLSDDCQRFAYEELNYQGCVNHYENDSNFYKPEWRIYLGSSNEMWQKDDTVTLKDSKGQIVDVEKY